MRCLSPIIQTRTLEQTTLYLQNCYSNSFGPLFHLMLLSTQKSIPTNWVLRCKNAVCPCIVTDSFKARRLIEKSCCRPLLKVLPIFTTLGSAKELSKNYTLRALRQLVKALSFCYLDILAVFWRRGVIHFQVHGAQQQGHLKLH